MPRLALIFASPPGVVVTVFVVVVASEAAGDSPTWMDGGRRCGLAARSSIEFKCSLSIAAALGDKSVAIPS